MTEELQLKKNFYTLGHSNLRVSPICLGTMNMAIDNSDAAWFKDEKTSRGILDTYVKQGGNFLDTANLYTGGQSERVVGKYLKEEGIRDDIVLATKFTGKERQNPNHLGNGRKNLVKSVEASLERLGTDYIDLLYLHFWDELSTPEEVMRSLDILVQSGKVNYVGLSDCPAWFVSRCQSLSMQHGYERIAAMQLEYNLIERNIEMEYFDMAKYYDTAIIPWSPLAGGFLTGKQTKEKLQGRVATGTWKGFERSEKRWEILDTLKEVAAEIKKTPVEVALNWTLKRPTISSVIIGASSIEQLDANLKSITFTIPEAQTKKLNDVSKPYRAAPYTFFEKGSSVKAMTYGDKLVVEKHPKWWHGDNQ